MNGTTLQKIKLHTCEPSEQSSAVQWFSNAHPDKIPASSLGKKSGTFPSAKYRPSCPLSVRGVIMRGKCPTCQHSGIEMQACRRAGGQAHAHVLYKHLARRERKVAILICAKTVLLRLVPSSVVFCKCRRACKCELVVRAVRRERKYVFFGLNYLRVRSRKCKRKTVETTTLRPTTTWLQTLLQVQG